MPKAGEIKILIAERHDLARFGLKVGLDKQPDMKVIATVETGPDAVEKSLELQPDVVLMDADVSTLNGIDAARKIKDELPSAQIIMMTTQSPDDDIVAALESNSTGYCFKSMPLYKLAVIVRLVSRGLVWIDPSLAGRLLNAVCGTAGDSSSKTECAPLSRAEFALLRLMSSGLDLIQIGNQFNIRLETLTAHMKRIFEKTIAAGSGPVARVRRAS
jgi:DNA-binding NarL/FixJ family response regulator